MPSTPVAWRAWRPITSRSPTSDAARAAVDAGTAGAGHAAFADDHVGSLSPGKDADLAVLSQ
jgi:predicted amidohydrolase YtcJ